MTERYTVKMPWPARELHSNSRAHYMVRHRAFQSAKFAAKMLCREAKVPCWPNAEILIEYYPPSYRGDIHNVPSALKAYIDGIADALGCDDKSFIVDYPTQWAGKVKGGEVVFHIIG